MSPLRRGNGKGRSKDMIRFLVLMLLAFSLILGPLSGPALAAHAHQDAVPMAHAAAGHDHCDPQPVKPMKAKAGPCAACPCAVGLPGLTPVGVAAAVARPLGQSVALGQLAPMGRDAAPNPRPPRL